MARFNSFCPCACLVSIGMFQPYALNLNPYALLSGVFAGLAASLVSCASEPSARGSQVPRGCSRFDDLILNCKP